MNYLYTLAETIQRLEGMDFTDLQMDEGQIVCEAAERLRELERLKAEIDRLEGVILDAHGAFMDKEVPYPDELGEEVKRIMESSPRPQPAPQTDT